MSNFLQILSESSLDYYEFFGEMIFIVFFLLLVIYAYVGINIRYLVNIKKNFKVFSNLAKFVGFGILPVVFMVFFVELFFSSSAPRQPTNATMMEMGAVRQVTLSLYAGQKDYSGLNNKIIIDSQQIPKRYSEENQLISPFGNIDIFPSQQKTEFVIVLSDIPSPACEKIANTDFGTGFVSMLVNQKTVPNIGNNSPTELHGLCDNKKNKLSFVFS